MSEWPEYEEYGYLTYEDILKLGSLNLDHSSL